MTDEHSRKRPTPERIDRLPQHIRDWIHDLESTCDVRKLREAEKIEIEAELIKTGEAVPTHFSHLPKHQQTAIDSFLREAEGKIDKIVNHYPSLYVEDLVVRWWAEYDEDVTELTICGHVHPKAD